MGAQWKHAGKQDAAAARGRIFTKLAKEIMVAARSGVDRRGDGYVAAHEVPLPADRVGAVEHLGEGRAIGRHPRRVVAATGTDIELVR